MFRPGRLLSRLNALAILLGSVIVILLILHVTLDVGLRYLFNAPLPGTIMIVSSIYMIFIVFLPVAAVEEDDGHISVELIYDRLSAALKRALRVLSLLLSGAVFGALTLRTFAEAMNKYETGSFVLEAGMRIPTWPAYFALPAGFGLMVAVLAYKLGCELTGRAPGLGGTPEGITAEAELAQKLRRGGE